MSQNKINIRPNVSMLSVLKFVEYETWFALAEFVDNSIASYLKNEKELKMLHGKNFQLTVIIEINDPENKITIRDNAGGIDRSNYNRAFRAAEIPADTTGLSEFGMGMKSASCWFSDFWTVRTKALNETEEKTVKFDMNKIFEDKLEELEFVTIPSDKNFHYTIIELEKVNKMPRHKGLAKVKSHLASIYRDFIRRGVLKLVVNNSELQFSESKILTAPKFDDVNGEKIEWKREIKFDVEDGLSVKGFVAIRETGSTAEAGFALFRRGRVIEGSFDNGFRPEFIFGASNSYRYQRVFGELHLEGFGVSFTKKGIQWDENLDVFLKCLKDELSHESFPLLLQAEKFRARANDGDYKKSGVKALSNTVSDFEKKAPEAIKETFDNSSVEGEAISEEELVKTDKRIYKSFKVYFNKINWLIAIELSYDTSLNDLLEVGPHLIKESLSEPNIKQIGIRLSLTHPFMVEYAGIENGKIEPILKMAAAMGLAEIIAKESGIKTQGEIRRNFNQLITKISKS
jgi:hypothetical protein